MIIEAKKIEKIISKIYSVALTQVLNGTQPNIKINVFKHLICGYKVPKREWLSLTKELENMGILTYHRNHYLEVKLNSEALVVAYRLSKPVLKITEPDRRTRQK
jgi:hypothetical protein